MRIESCGGELLTVSNVRLRDDADDAYTLACETEAEDDGEDDGESTCEFDSDLAQECVTGVEELACDFYSTGTGFPSSCTDYCG